MRRFLLRPVMLVLLVSVTLLLASCPSGSGGGY
jgi:hypothetical protein